MKKLLTLIWIITTTLLITEFLVKYFIPQNISGSWRVQNEYGLMLNKNSGKSLHTTLGDYKSNYSFGKFHNRKYNLEENENKILVLGDSVTFGWGLNDEDTFIYKLAKKFSDYEFINAAAGGWGTADYTRYYDDFCKLIKPKYTLIFIDNFDLDRSIESNLYNLNNKDELVKGENIINLNKKIMNSLPFYDYLIERSHLLNLLKVIILSPSKPMKFNLGGVVQAAEVTKDKNQLLSEKLFFEIKKISNKCNSKLIIFNIGWWDYNIQNTITSIFLRNSKSFFGNNKVIYFDLNNEMSEVSNNKKKYSNKEDNLHPNKIGSNILYNKIKPKLEKLIK